MTKYALCIGINNYPGTESDLAGCVNDTDDWSAELSRRGFAVSRLTDRQATGAAMRTAIRKIIAGADSGDLIVVQYSGHGSFVPDENGDEPDGADECLCPYDVHSRGPITDDELFSLYGTRQDGVKLVMISDSCNSGSVTKFAPISKSPAGRGVKTRPTTVRFLPPAAFLSKREAAKFGVRRAVRASSSPGRNAGLLLAGCQETEYSYDAYFQGRPNGAFTFVALQTLAKLSRSATYADWYAAIRNVLPSQQYPQTPNLFGTKSMKKWKVFA